MSNAALKNKKKREAKKAKDADAKDWTDQPPQQAITEAQSAETDESTNEAVPKDNRTF